MHGSSPSVSDGAALTAALNSFRLPPEASEGSDGSVRCTSVIFRVVRIWRFYTIELKSYLDEILQLLSRLDDIIINTGTVGQVLKKKTRDMGEGRMSASLVPQRSAEGSRGSFRGTSCTRRLRAWYDVTQMLQLDRRAIFICFYDVAARRLCRKVKVSYQKKDVFCRNFGAV